MWEQFSQSLAGVNLASLSVNQAFLNVTSHLSHRIWMYSLSENCVRVSFNDLTTINLTSKKCKTFFFVFLLHQCPFTRNREIASYSHALMKFDASRQIVWKFFDKDQGRYAFNNV